jgi:DNA-binding IclR family transcriptional regulator
MNARLDFAPTPEGATGRVLPAGRDRKRGIDRIIMLLEALLKQRRPMAPGEIARAIGAPRSTTYEIVNRLLEAEMLDYAGPDKHVYFGRAMHLFGWAYGHHDAQHRRLVATLDHLAAESGATAQLCGLRGNKYVVLDCRDAPGLFRITSDVGAQVPIPWTASGRLLLAHMTEEEIRTFVPAEDYRLPDGRLLAFESFLADIAKARAQGYCETTGLADRFTCCMAAPIRDASGDVRTTLCLVLSVDTPEPRRAELLALLCERAGSVSLDSS